MAAGFFTGYFKQNCETCRTDQKARERWGCDGPTEHVQYSLECWDCKGIDPCCKTCSGTGQEHFYACPMLEIADLTGFLFFYTEKKQGFLPEPGGLLDQASSFLDACELLDAEIAKQRKAIGENG